MHAQNIIDRRVDFSMHRLHLVKAEVGQVTALGLRAGHEAAGDMMRLAEWHIQHPHKPVGQVRRGRKA